METPVRTTHEGHYGMSGLTFSNVSKEYPSQKQRSLALDDVSFEVGAGEIVGLIGKNGAGKTTSLKIAAGFISEYSGDVQVNDILMSSRNAECRLISYIPDSPVFYEFMTLRENLAFVEDLYPQHDWPKTSDLIDIFELDEHLDKMPNKLSKGTKQKMSISMALLRDYSILLADEPFSGLDPENISNLKQLLIELKKIGKGILVSTHLLNMVESFCDRYVILDKGKLIASGDEEKLKALSKKCSTSIESIFLELTS